MTDKELFIRESKEVLKSFDKLRIGDSNSGSPMLIGEIELIDVYGKHWDTYQVEIHCSNDFPMRFPVLYETGGKLIRDADWHINETDGSCCVEVLQKEIIICSHGISLMSYLTDYVKPYLFNQTHRILRGFYANGEYSHGIAGSIEFYQATLGLKQQSNILEALNLLALGSEPTRRSYCFCGSHIKYRKCHKMAFNSLKAIPKKQIEDDIFAIRRFQG